MYYLDDDFDDDIVQVANNVDEDFRVASQLGELEKCDLERQTKAEENDFELALKLSEELNCDFPRNDPPNLPPASRNASLNSSSSSNTIKLHDDKDFELALTLSEELNKDFLKNHSSRSCDNLYSKFSPINKTNNLKDKNNDYLLAIQLSNADRLSATDEQIEFTFDDDSDVDEVVANSTDSDYLLAVQLAQTDSPPKSRKTDENGANVSKYLNRDLSVVHPSWETIDPNPDIYALFIAFNKRFFWGKLDMVEVRWSPRMTLCAGICSYQRRAGHCVVKLSKPLLQLRPRKDLVETLLHEMIHAYLFVTRNDRDRDGHGPRFHSHMFRINRESGANITVYHSFHDEVRYYQQHEWRCNGVCRDRPPFYGYVRRAVNRAPGPSDNWWCDHRARCGGNFVKIKEPEGYGKRKPAPENRKTGVKQKKPMNGIENYFKISPSKTNISAPVLSFAPPKMPAAVKTSSTNNLTVNTPSSRKKIFTLSDLSNKRSPTKSKSPSDSPKKWVPLPGQRNILHFVDKS